MLAELLVTFLLKIPDKDLEERRVGQRIDPATGEMFTKDIYDPDKVSPLVRIHSLDGIWYEVIEAKLQKCGCSTRATFYFI